MIVVWTKSHCVQSWHSTQEFLPFPFFKKQTAFVYQQARAENTEFTHQGFMTWKYVKHWEHEDKSETG